MEKTEIKNAIEDFGTAYYFLMRIRILNSELLLRIIQHGKIRNGVLLELAYGYIQVAAVEFSLNLYDIIELIKQLDGKYKYPTGSAIDHVLCFRRSVVAHRGKNWHSEESRTAHAALEESANSIFEYSKAAMEEFREALHRHGIFFGPSQTRPVAQLFRQPDLDRLLKAVPEFPSSMPIPSEEELLAFFGRKQPSEKSVHGTRKTMKLREIPGTYSVVRLAPDAPIPDWGQKSSFFSISRTNEELSIVCDSSVVPSGDFKRENNWKCLKVVGPLDFSLTGILSSIAGPLAVSKISIFAISTFDTDYIMVKQENFSRAKESLKEAGFDLT